MRLSYTNTRNKDIFYLTRLDITDDFFTLELEEKVLVFLDHREYEVFKEHNINLKIEVVLLNPIIEKLHDSHGDLIQNLSSYILEHYGDGSTELEVSNHFPLDLADYLRSKGYTLTLAKSLRPERAIKREEEISFIEKSIKDTQKAYLHVEAILKDSQIVKDELIYKDQLLTSEFLKKEVDRVLFDNNLLNTEGIIISSGNQAAIPHHSGSGPIKPHETIVCDFFPVSRETGYFADMTRTYVKGEPSEKLTRMYESVLKAQETAFSLIKPGAYARDIHEAVVAVFLEDGFHVGDKGFVHGTGHGIGLEIHENPRVNKKTSHILEEGHIFTVEPGLYYPGVGGIRIEDVVLVTRDGYRNLTNYPKEFAIK